MAIKAILTTVTKDKYEIVIEDDREFSSISLTDKTLHKERLYNGNWIFIQGDKIVSIEVKV